MGIVNRSENMYVVDQKALLKLRITMHIELDKFKKELKAIFRVATKQKMDPLVFLSPVGDKPDPSPLQSLLSSALIEPDTGKPPEGTDDDPEDDAQEV